MTDSMTTNAMNIEKLTDDMLELQLALDNTYLIICASIVFFMQAGFAALEIGTVRVQNSASILMKNFSDIFYSASSFFLIGFSIAFAKSETNNTFIGTGSYDILSIEDYAFFFFQISFASTSATIVSGGMLERTKHTAYNVWTVILIMFIYPCVAHWVWSDTGWLSSANDEPLLGYFLIDFAGAGVVHLVGGIGALVGSYLVGARHGFLDSNGNVVGLPGHSPPLSGIGAFILWFGFYAFNCGSTLSVSDGNHKIASLIAINTTMSGAFAGLVANALALYGPKQGPFSGLGISEIINCSLAGLVSITASCSTVNPWIAALIGVISALVFILIEHTIKNVLKIDDALSAFAVHGGGGIWGLISAGLFSHSESTSSLFYGDISQFLVQIMGVVLISTWSGVLSWIAFTCIDRVIGLRISSVTEIEGMDAEIGAGQSNEMLKIKAALFESNGLDTLIKHPGDQMIEKFRAFLQKEYADEHLEFLLECDAWRIDVMSKISTSESTPGDEAALNAQSGGSDNVTPLHASARALFDRHVVENDINISSNCKTDLSKKVLENFPMPIIVKAFSRAYLEVLVMLKGDAWRRFVITEREENPEDFLTNAGKTMTGTF